MMFSSTKRLDCTGLLPFLLESVLTVASDSFHFSSWSATGEQTPNPPSASHHAWKSLPLLPPLCVCSYLREEDLLFSYLREEAPTVPWQKLERWVSGVTATMSLVGLLLPGS